MQIQILKTRGLGKFCSSRTSGPRVGEMDEIFGKVPSGAIYPNLLGPAGVDSPPKAGKNRKFRELL